MRDELAKITAMKSIASNRSGKCLSSNYVNAKNKLLWECSQGHQWQAAPDKIKRGSWCPECAKGKGGKPKLTIEVMHKIAKKHGGKCLTEEYINSKTKLLWECAIGHQWEAVPSSILRGSWCATCAGRGKVAIEDMQKIAKERGGKCLSTKYVNAKTKLLWQCAEGHQWEATPDKVKRGTWCRTCSGFEKPDIKNIRKFALEKGGKCISQKYVNNNTKMLWECSYGHRWEAVYASIKAGSWCPTCFESRKGASQRLSIEDMHQLAIARGGACLSNTYSNTGTKLLWQCSEGHQWSAEPRKIKTGRWCPTCSTGLGERICRSLFQQIFDKPFPKMYPDWLINSRGNQMELDGYCEDLKLAFEHQGIQHYKESEFYYNKTEDFHQRQADDKVKEELCRKHGVVLVHVPELFSLLNVAELFEHVVKQVSKSKISIPTEAYKKTFDFNDAYKTSYARQYLDELRDYATLKGGELLTDTYVNSKTKIPIKCGKGHQWETLPESLKQGTWCPECHGNTKGNIETMRELAESRGGKCISTHYIKSTSNLTWECSKGHRWEATPGSIKGGSWCMICNGNALGTIEDMQQIAKERGGKCLSIKYVNAKTKLLWQCAEGHQWNAVPSHIKQGKWCPQCATKRTSNAQRKSIRDMIYQAELKRGTCISNEYKNAHTKLKWRCAIGHEWEATPNKIQQGRWCPECSKLSKKSLAD